jgi:pyruvyltransferase
MNNESYKIFHWKPDQALARNNFGDDLFPFICDAILKQHIKTTQASDDKKLIAGGSTLHFARAGDVVWGAGVRSEQHEHLLHGIDVRAVRGPLTREYLLNKAHIHCPEIYGDPALLLPKIFPDWQAKPISGRVGVVPHYRDVGLVPALPERYRVILPSQPLEEVIADILSCEFVISSSLHGLIVAEAFGIPARWLRLSPIEPDFKFIDYYLGTGRRSIAATSIMQAEYMGGEAPIRNFDTDRLYKAFPFDLNFDYE